MDNILYIGPYREFSGMGNAARQYIKALIFSGHNISIRPSYNYYISYPSESIDNSILELEKNNSKHYHKIIQHCYPHQLVFDGRFDENIGLIHLESINNTNMIKDHLSIMDKIIVGSKFVRLALNQLDIRSGIYVIPEPINLESILDYRNNNPIEISDYNYKFYAIGSFEDRKNINALLMAFLICSNHYSDIDLSIKLRHIDGVANAQEYIEYEFEKIYTTVRKNFVKKPKLYIGNTNDSNILYLHNNNDCYISTSYGESFGYSALEAMAFNNQIIVTENTGFDDFIDNSCGLKIASDLVSCKDKNRIFPIYNSVYQKWNESKIDDIIEKMFLAINESKTSKKQRIKNQTEKIKRFTTQAVAEQFKTL